MARIILSSKFCLSRFDMTYARFMTPEVQKMMIGAGSGLGDKKRNNLLIIMYN